MAKVEGLDENLDNTNVVDSNIVLDNNIDITDDESNDIKNNNTDLVTEDETKTDITDDESNDIKDDNKDLEAKTDTEDDKLNDSTLNQESEDDVKYALARSEAKWYVLHTFSGYENVAKENLEIVRIKYNLKMRIFDVVIPMEDVIEEKNGKQKVVARKLMPGYIIVKMIYGDDIWHAVTRTRGITGFVGPKGRPLHLTEEEIHKMRLEKQESIDTDLKENDKIEVLEGALNGFTGTLLSLDIPSNKCKVIVEMFGRDTAVDLALTQIRRIN